MRLRLLHINQLQICICTAAWAVMASPVRGRRRPLAPLRTPASRAAAAAHTPSAPRERSTPRAPRSTWKGRGRDYTGGCAFQSQGKVVGSKEGIIKEGAASRGRVTVTREGLQGRGPGVGVPAHCALLKYTRRGSAPYKITPLQIRVSSRRVSGYSAGYPQVRKTPATAVFILPWPSQTVTLAGGASPSVGASPPSLVMGFHGRNPLPTLTATRPPFL